MRQPETESPPPPRRGLRLLPWCALALAMLVTPYAGADELKPFEASYAWLWHGMTVAVSNLKLENNGDSWSYSAKSEPRGIGRAFSERPTQLSILKVSDAGVQPQSYVASDGTSSTKRAINLTYDWAQHRVTGVYEDTKVDLPLTPALQDDASVQVAMMVELLHGRIPDRFELIDKNSAREYRYRREGEATLQTPMGPIATVIYASQRANSPRVTRFWCAPERGFIPLRVEQKKDDDVQWTMEIQSLKRG